VLHIPLAVASDDDLIVHLQTGHSFVYPVLEIRCLCEVKGRLRSLEERMLLILKFRSLRQHMSECGRER
jgi:hypothetical protein